MRLIDASALMVAVEGNPLTTESLKEYVRCTVREQPTIDAEPVRHGKWIFNPSDAFEAMFAKPKCSECGFESADGGNYCPNCGARMDEE